MYSKAHSISIKGNNLGSCKQYAEYLDKTEGKFFNNNGNEFTSDQVYQDIDKHGKGQLGKEDAKWYSPIYSFSENESQHIAEQVTGRKVENYNDLNISEKEKYNDRIGELAVKYQDEMAKNFNKEELGIKSNEDLKWYGKIENERNYKGFDEQVINGHAKSGQLKLGFNTHIHIIQSRKANNLQKSKLSPESSQKNRSSNNKIQQGFDRNSFKNKIEQTFDKETHYKRPFNEKYEYYGLKKLNKLQELEQFKNNNLEMKSIKQHHLEIAQLKEVEQYQDYLKEMEKRGIEVTEIQNHEQETYDLELESNENSEKVKFSELPKEREEEIKSQWLKEQNERMLQIEEQIHLQNERIEREREKELEERGLDF